MNRMESKQIEVFHVVQGNRHGDFVVLDPAGGYVKGNDGRWYWFTRAEAEQAKREAESRRTATQPSQSSPISGEVGPPANGAAGGQGSDLSPGPEPPIYREGEGS
jgi:hypothetical protein